jgi:hypothetical protein
MKKLTEELDIIHIIKTLRQSRFIIEKFMTMKQQNMIDFFREYSLETPSTIPHKFQYSTTKLLRNIEDDPDDEMNTILANRIIQQVDQNRKYIARNNKEESNSEDSHDEPGSPEA